MSHGPGSIALQVDMTRPSLHIISMVGVLFALPSFSHRNWKSERVIAGLYLNKTTGCDVYVSRSQRNICHRIDNLSTVLKTATMDAIALCKAVFEYEHWPCQIDDKIFFKAGKERALLTSLLSWSVSQTAARFCANGELSGCYSWPPLTCSDCLNYGAHIAFKYFLAGGIGRDHVGRMVKHNIENGIKESVEMNCFCYEHFYNCRIRICWTSGFPYIKLSELFLDKYHTAYKLKTNRVPLKGLRKRRKQLVYLEDNEDICSGTQNRKCRDPDNCSYLCCGRGFIKHRLRLQKFIDCNCSFKPFILCKKCIEYKIIYKCR